MSIVQRSQLSEPGAEIQRGQFSGHETFPLRYTWLPKVIHGLQNYGHSVFTQEDAMLQFGVGKNMVKAMRHWSLATGAVESHEDPETKRPNGYQATLFGQTLFDEEHGYDPFFECEGTAWLVHWQLASNPNAATTWYWVFSYLPRPEFTRDDLSSWLLELVEKRGWTRTKENSIKRDVACFLRTYAQVKTKSRVSQEDLLDCPLSSLGLIRQFGSRDTFMLTRHDQPGLPDDIFIYGLCDFLTKQGDERRVIGLEDLAFAAGSPGRVFCLSEHGLMVRLERLERLTDGAIRFDETAGLRQVILTEKPEPRTWLKRYYGFTETAAP